MPTPLPTHIECINPLLRVEDMTVGVRYVTTLHKPTSTPFSRNDVE